MLDSLNKQTFTIVLFHNICYELSDLDYLETGFTNFRRT